MAHGNPSAPARDIGKTVLRSGGMSMTVTGRNSGHAGGGLVVALVRSTPTAGVVRITEVVAVTAVRGGSLNHESVPATPKAGLMGTWIDDGL